jgi:hypothetical protein
MFRLGLLEGLGTCDLYAFPQGDCLVVLSRRAQTRGVTETAISLSSC